MSVVAAIVSAANFAAIKHKEQKRKDPEGTPYINHPIGVAYILTKVGKIFFLLRTNVHFPQYSLGWY